MAEKEQPVLPSETSTTKSSMLNGAIGESRPLSRSNSEKDAKALEEGVETPVPEPTPVAETEYPKSFKLVAIVVALILSIFLVSLDMTIVATAIPRITDQFHSLNQVGWYGSAFFLTLASFQSTWGKVYKYFPIKISFLISIFIFELGSLICAVANSSTTLIVGRAVAGAGGAGIASGAYTIIAFSAPPKQRPAFTGLLGATYGCASVIGPLLGGVFTEKISWRWCFYINLPIGGVSAAIILFTFVAPRSADPIKADLKEKLLQMDLLGTFTIMAAVVCYLLALQWGGVTKSWGSADVIGTLVGFVLLIVAFVVNELFQGERALLQGRLLKKKIIIVVCVYVIFLAGSFFMLLYYLPIYFQSVDGTTPSQSGIRNIPLVIAASLFTIVSGGLITVYGHYVPLMIIASILATVGSGLIYTLGINTASSHWIGFQVVVGVGLGLGLQIPVIVAQSTVAPTDISAITAVVLFFQTIGGSFFVSAAQTAFANKLVSSLASNAPHVDAAKVIATGATQLRQTFDSADIPGILLSYLDGLRVAFALGIALAGVSLIASFFAPWRKIDASALMGGG